jgi:hypothetical protein
MNVEKGEKILIYPKNIYQTNNDTYQAAKNKVSIFN